MDNGNQELKHYHLLQHLKYWCW